MLNFVDTGNDWTSENGNLKNDLFLHDNLHLVEKGNFVFSNIIFNAINSLKRDGMKAIKTSPNESFALEGFPPLPRKGVINIFNENLVDKSYSSIVASS